MNNNIHNHISEESSEDDDDDLSHSQPSFIQGTLCKWTNYIHGWQNRYIVLQDGKLSYYKNKDETSLGCRGSLSVNRAVVKCHEIDDCRFDVCINDSVWYLRTSSCDERELWVDAIERQKECGEPNQFSSNFSLLLAAITTEECGEPNQFGSNLSLSHSVNSCTSAIKKMKQCDLDAGLQEKLSEVETFRSIIVKQVDILQSYFDACSRSTSRSDNFLNSFPEVGEEATSLVSQRNSPLPSPRHVPDGGDGSTPSGGGFKGEALTFKATTTAILTSIGQCVEMINAKNESFKKRLEKEVEKRRRLELELKEKEKKSKEDTPTRYVVMGGPDYEEGPHSVIGEDEFYDAVESALDKLEEEDEFRERLRQKQRRGPQQPANKHPLWPTIEKWTHQQLQYAREAVVGGVWQLFNEDGEMKMYRRELEEDGLVVDPLKAVHQVTGVTGHEMAHHFWSPDVRFEWDTTIEQMSIMDTISEDTLVFLQIHKRVWPTAQRDALFWSHIRKVVQTETEQGESEPVDTWIVCNRSTEHADAPNEGNCVRVDLLVCMVCQTFLKEKKEEPLSRDDLVCKITYCSIVNPGGWAPASVLRTVYKREYPRFLKRFTQYVIDKCQDQPIAFSGLKILNHSKHWRG